MAYWKKASEIVYPEKLLPSWERSFPICAVTNVVIIGQIGDDQSPQLGDVHGSLAL